MVALAGEGCYTDEIARLFELNRETVAQRLAALRRRYVTAKPRKNPCPSCPYRQDCPSGVWAAEEYDKLPEYDEDTAAQGMKGALGVFMCHQGAGDVCAGWAAVHGDDDNLALKIARAADPGIDVAACLDYTTGVPLWESGAEAAAHGKRDIESPDLDAAVAIAKITRVREIRGMPVAMDGRDAHMRDGKITTDDRAEQRCDPDLPSAQSPVPHEYESDGDEYGSLAEGGSYERLRCRNCPRIAYRPLPD